MLGAGVALAAVAPARAAGGARLGTRARRSRSALCVALAAVGAAAARLGASLAALCAAASARHAASVRRAGKPLWQRLYLDVVALAVSGLVYWLTARTGFSAVVNPDSNPTLSLSVYMFLAPALLWIGAALLLVRLRGRRVAWLAAPRRRRPRDDAARLPARERRPARRARSTAACSSSACCSPSASTSASSPRPTTSRRGSTRS